MDFVYAAVLGVVQGVAEFLPISSDGHLVIAKALLMAWSGEAVPEWLSGTTMIIALHFGTLLSIIVVYYVDLLALRHQPRLLFLIFVASIPAGVIGLAFKDKLEEFFDHTVYAGFGLLVTAVFLIVAKKWQRGVVGLRELTPSTALVIGIFQAIAILPGVSRSGGTIASAMVCGLKRPDAARFSFLIAVPVLAGVTLLKLIDILKDDGKIDVSWQPMLLGAVISFVVGLLCLKLLIRLLLADRLHWFAVYCLIVGGLTIAWQYGAFGSL